MRQRWEAEAPRGLRLAGMAAVLACAAIAPNAMGTPSVASLYAFRGKADGASPEGGVIQGLDGTIYGTADQGGVDDNGTVFSLTPPAVSGGTWTFKVLYCLQGGAGGGYPLGLTQDKNGNLYGYAIDFGAGHGTVFQLQKPATPGKAWRFRTLYAFQGGKDGDFPSGLAVQPDGDLIGTTGHGGGRGACRDAEGDTPYGCGTVFQLTPPAAKGGAWTETVLYRFAGGADGAIPIGAPIRVGGALYGVTTEGGGGPCDQPGTGTTVGCGSVYKLSQARSGKWVETVFYRFPGGGSGWAPVGGLTADSQGKFYGATAFGGLDANDGYGNGLVFELTPATAGGFSEIVLHQFAGGAADGYQPQSGVLLDQQGNLHGTTYLGPIGAWGIAYTLAPPGASGGLWTETVDARFSGPAGAYPTGSLAIGGNGALYGVTLQGGRYNQGAVYQVAP